MKRLPWLVCGVWFLLGGALSGQEGPTAPRPQPGATVPQSFGGPNPALTGENITLNVENEDIASVLKMLSLSRGVNIVAGPLVTGPVSVNLYDVPFEDALDAILGVAGFTHYTKDNVIYVTTEDARAKLPPEAGNLVIRSFRINHAKPEEVVKTIEAFLSPAGKAILTPQERTIVVRDAPEYVSAIAELVAQQDLPARAPSLTVRSFRIDHAKPDELLATVEKLVSANGQAVLNAKEKTIVVQDAAEYVAMIAQVIAQQDAPARQVLIAAEILRVSRDDDLDLGVELRRNWWDPDTVAFSRNPGTGAFTQGAGLTQDLGTLNEAGGGLLIGDLSSGNQGLLWSGIWKDKEIFLTALATKGKVETLAAPEILALDGEEARMIIGDKLGYKTFSRADDGTTFEKVEFLDVGTQLTVTPEIARDGLIRMKILPKVSSGQIGDGVPVENTTEVETTMLVRNGETIVIGGLISVRKERTRSQVPFLGDIPYLGLLFGHNVWIDAKTELVILITPHIVGPDRAPFMDARIEEYTKDSKLYPDESLYPRDPLRPQDQETSATSPSKNHDR